MRYFICGVLLAAGTLVSPAVAAAGCPPGQTGVIYGCAPFCVDGKALDTQTGLCMPVAPPPDGAQP